MLKEVKLTDNYIGLEVQKTKHFLHSTATQ